MDAGLTEDFNSFLRERGVGEDVIDYMTEEKIDCSVVLAMNKSDSSELVKLFPKFGDRYAVLEFCKRTSESSSKKRKHSLLERLKEKINKKNETLFQKPDENQNHGSDDDLFIPKKSRSKVTHEQKNSKKSRTIEIGWVCQRQPNKTNLTHIRSRQGGGTRKVVMKKTATKVEILNKALDLFFPEGECVYGKISEFDHDIFDFKQNILPDNISIQSIYDTTGLTMTRFYLSSLIKSKTPTSQTFTSVNIIENNAQNQQAEEEIDDYLHATSSNSIERIYSALDAQEDQLDLYAESDNRMDGALDASQSVGVDMIFDPNETTITKLVIHRGQVVRELIQAFQYLNLNGNGRVEVEMILPNGQPERALDTGGVFRDCLGEFWTSFYDQYTEGTTLKIPIISQEFNKDQWTAVAKIIKVGWEQEKYFPIKIVPVIFEQCIYNAFTSDLVGVFLMSLASTDRKMIEDALLDFSLVDEDSLVEVFSNLKSKRIPTKDNLLAILHEIAHKELIQRPFYIKDCWTPVLSNLMPEITFKELREKMLPTARNILEKLRSPEENSNLENKAVYNFLKKFIREADDHLLSSFVRFCTGADVLTGKEITVSFNSDCGFARTPIGHVCGNVLELPNTYDSFVKFRNEFSSVLNSSVWVMDIV